jgi:hypothetical protein
MKTKRKQINLNVQEPDLAAWKEAARSEERTLSHWMRWHLNQVIKRMKKKETEHENSN